MSIRAPTHDRLTSAVGVAAVHALLGYALLAGLGYSVVEAVADPLKVFDVREAPPPPPVEPPAPAAAEAAEGAAAPPDLKATPAPVVAPPPEVRLPIPPPVVAAPVAGPASDPSAGASDRPGPATAAGGAGTGTGRGGAGGGPGGGVAVPARQIAGGIDDRDYPRAAARARLEGRVLVRFTVDPGGRAGACAVLRSSGSFELDDTTCRLIERRFRFVPARDAQGRAVPDDKAWEQVWWLEGR